jgi:signal transduction histidine kinase
MLVLGATTWLLVKNSLEGGVKARLQQEADALAAMNDPGDPARIVAETERRAAPEVNSLHGYRLVAADGRHLAGDAWLEPGPLGWSVQSDTGLPWVGGRVISLTVPIAPAMRLTIGRDVGWIDEVDNAILSLLGWALLGGALLAVLAAVAATWFMSKRIALFTNTASAIINGDLSQRIPVIGAGDDFDRLASTLNSMLERIQELMGNLEQVTNDIAHDLRTPLGRLRQHLELARSDADASHRARIESAIGEADSLLAMFSALLRIGQIEADARHSAFRFVDISDVAATIADAYALSAEDSGHVLSQRILPGLRVRGDRDLLTQMFANLVENALTHTPKGTRIEVAVTSRDFGRIEALVSDNGPGVPADQRDKIFHRFYRLEASRTTPGTGLGLALVAAIAELHGGSIAAEDNSPGLRVRVVFPAVDARASPYL